MPQFSYPGVYVSEKRGGPAPITGVSTSTLALIGFTREGLVDEPIDTFGFPDFAQKLGDFTSLSLLPTHAFHFYKNGGTKAVVVRVVADDAATADCFLSESVTGEALTTDPAFDGVETAFLLVGANGLNITPVVAGTLVVTTTGGGGNDEEFTDNGDGTLTGDDGGSGTIDYDTGEITLTYNVAPTGGDTATAAYDYKTFGFEMLWPGAAGNEFDVRIVGDPVFENQATASFTRFEIEVRRTENGEVDVKEQFTGIVFDDASSENFVTTVLNDNQNGSRIVAVTAFGNNVNPSSLAGTAVSAEVLTETPAYDGTERAFDYTLANSLNPTSLQASIALAENGVSVGTGVAGTAQTAQLESGSIADSATLSIDFGGATEVFTLTTPGDGSGALTGDQGGSGTVDFDTGAVALTLNTAAAGGEAIVGEWNYRPHIIVDDGAGSVSIQAGGTGPSNWTLDSNGTNEIAYGDPATSTAAVLSLTWRKTSNPTLGPTDTTVTVIQTADYYTQSAETESICDLGDTASGFTAGADGSAVGRSNISAATLAADKRGLFALDKTDELLQIVIPDFETDPTVSGDLVDYVDGRRDRFAIISVPEGFSTQEAINYKKSTLNKSSNKAAIYYPHIEIIDPITEKAVNVPPGGHVAGIYARVDNERNVSKAPAGKQDGAIRFAIGLERELSFAECGELNKNNINCLMDNEQTGRAVWGARTLETVGEFPYIQMRRLFMFVEKSVFDATHIHVFESNTPALRARIKLQIESFLLGLFNTGHFSGTTPEDAFFVVDKTTADDVASGIVRFEIGLAPTRPAEFISFEFQQKTLENA